MRVLLTGAFGNIGHFTAFASSYTVHGPRNGPRALPLLTAATPVAPTPMQDRLAASRRSRQSRSSVSPSRSASARQASKKPAISSSHAAHGSALCEHAHCSISAQVAAA